MRMNVPGQPERQLTNVNENARKKSLFLGEGVKIIMREKRSKECGLYH